VLPKLNKRNTLKIALVLGAPSLGTPTPILGARLSHFMLFYLNKLSCFILKIKQKENVSSASNQCYNSRSDTFLSLITFYL
jgi:hypothetical protein